ncbi:MAG: M20 family metallopeptidase [Candidatus Bathyarchaeia archaeon]|nr:ArgE/DapE family deacylase [Candidatus Bathyarchaeota archaeon A05DMB-4]MDH7595843.1 ArgE/DapE family deacylase [Candidatus Bathyarchaeota archaeon]
MKALNRKVDEFLKEHEKEVVDFCSKLVQAGGENPPGDVTKVAKVVETFLDKHGVSYKRYEPRKGHVNILATVGKGTPKIILCGHIDVVPAGDPKHWKVPPYSGTIEDGKIYGRGASDMKGGVASMLMASAALACLEKELSGTAVLAVVCDEEDNGPAGAHWLLKNHKLDGDVCLITEPTGYLHSQYSIIGGERGNLWVRLIAKGKPAHGSTPAFGKNAILLLIKALKKLDMLEAMPVKTPKDAKALVRNGKLDMTRTAKGMGIRPKELTRTMDHYTVNIGTIKGGTKTNVVPEQCEAEIDIRIPAGGHPDAVEEFIKFITSKDFEYQITNRTLASYTPANEPLVKILQKHGKNVLGYKPQAIYMAATSDAHSFRETLGIPTISFGPGYGEVNHAYNEFVNAKDVVDATKIYAHTILDYSQR